MSDYREIEIIVTVFGDDNIMTDEQAKLAAAKFDIAVSELATVDDVMEGIKNRIRAIEDAL